MCVCDQTMKTNIFYRRLSIITLPVRVFYLFSSARRISHPADPKSQRHINDHLGWDSESTFQRINAYKHILYYIWWSPLVSQTSTHIILYDVRNMHSENAEMLTSFVADMLWCLRLSPPTKLMIHTRVVIYFIVTNVVSNLCLREFKNMLCI